MCKIVFGKIFCFVVWSYRPKEKHKTIVVSKKSLDGRMCNPFIISLCEYTSVIKASEMFTGWPAIKLSLNARTI